MAIKFLYFLDDPMLYGSRCLAVAVLLPLEVLAVTRIGRFLASHRLMKFE